MAWMAAESTCMPLEARRRREVPQPRPPCQAPPEETGETKTMQPHAMVALVTLLALITYLGLGFNVGRMRAKTGIMAPTMTGDPRLERAVRVQMNTLEWLPIFLGSMW